MTTAPATKAIPYNFKEEFHVEPFKLHGWTEAVLYRHEDGTPFLIEQHYEKDGTILLQAEVNKDTEFSGKYTKFHKNGKISIETRKDPRSRDSRWSDGAYCEYYENGQLKLEGRTHYALPWHSRFIGVAKEYYENGKPKNIKQYNHNGELEGPYAEFYEDGKPKVLTQKAPVYGGSEYRGSISFGRYKEYHPNGKVKIEGQKDLTGAHGAEDGFDGLVKEYDENGILRKQSTYDKGALKGDFSEYDEDGKITKSYTIEHGSIRGPYREYFKNGQIKIDSCVYTLPVSDGFKQFFNGSYKEYYEDGQIKIDGIRTSQYQGAFNGAYQEYHPNGKLKIEGNRTGYRGDFCDYRKEYYDNGQLKYDEQYTTVEISYSPSTFLNGPYKEYAEDGTLLLDCTYKRDRFAGPYKKYNDAGTLIIDGTAADMPELCFTGPYREYHDNGELKIDAFAKERYNRNSRHYESFFIGLFKEYHPNGKLKIESLRDEKEGRFHGPYLEFHDSGELKTRNTIGSSYDPIDYEEYHPNGTLKLHSTIRYGKFEGEYREYHDNGHLKTQGTLKNRDPWGNYTGTHFSDNIATYNRDGHLISFSNHVSISFTQKDHIPVSRYKIDPKLLTRFKQGGMECVILSPIPQAPEIDTKELVEDSRQKMRILSLEYKQDNLKIA